MGFILFMLGAAIGSFLSVIADRYKDGLPLWDKKIIGGSLGSEASRSRCEFCGAQLRWFELIPIVSFFLQRGRCNSCGGRLGWHYIFTEIITGLVFVFVPASIKVFLLSTTYHLPPTTYYILSVLWVAVFSILFLISLIDYRLKMIPDEANIALVFLGLLITFFQPFNGISESFIGRYGALFGWQSDKWLSHLAGGGIALLFFAAMIFITRGRGMGGGDMKLAGAMGLIFGWPDIMFVVVSAFIIGSVFGTCAILLKKENLKSSVAFGPFLALAGLIVFLFGFRIVDSYFNLFGIV